MKLDDIHYTFNKIDGCQKDINLIVSAREAGKSTAAAAKAARAFNDRKAPSIMLLRQVADVTDAYIDTQAKILRKFELGRGITYKRSSLAEGVVYGNDLDTGTPRLVFVGMSAPLHRLKSLMIEAPAYIFNDEFMVNTRAGEKYLKGEVFRFKEIYSTFYRESVGKGPKCYFMGNPYSFYNPYFSEYGIDPRKGKFQTGDKWAFEYYPLDPRLIAKIREKNPFFEEDNDYARYAFGGEPINDSNIMIVDKCPPGFTLWSVVTIESKRLGIFVNNLPWGDNDIDFWIGYLPVLGSRRMVTVFDFKDLAMNSALFTQSDRLRFARLKYAIQRRAVGYQTVECDYLIEEVYNQL